jgi:hypothetical protein
MLAALRRYWPAIILIVGVLLILDGTISSLETCHPPSNHSGASHDNKENCTIFHGPVALLIIGFGNFFETHDKGIVAAFTVILAMSTIGLWTATINLYKSGEQQIKTSITVLIFCWLICLISESIGHHDSEIMDDRSID